MIDNCTEIQENVSAHGKHLDLFVTTLPVYKAIVPTTRSCRSGFCTSDSGVH